MSETPKESAVPPTIPNDLGLKLQTTMPSAIKKRSKDGATRSGSVASTLRGSQNKKLSTPDSEALPNGWVRIKHPDSGVYYYVNEEKGLSTSSDVLHPRTHFLIMEGTAILQRSPALQALLEDQEVDLVLDVQHVNGATRMSYYCVSHVERRVFWLEGIGHQEVDIPCTSNECMKSKGSRVHCIEAQYWAHCEQFPVTFTVTKDVIDELKDILLQAAADNVLARFSTSPYGKNDLESMLNMVRGIEDAREGSGHSAWVIAGFMALYNDGVLRSSYGQGDDYFDIKNIGSSIVPYQRHSLLVSLGLVFLNSPALYASELHSFLGGFTPARWVAFGHKFDQTIRDSNLLATVLLSTNVGLLAWSENGKAGGISSPTPEQILAYISIIFSIGSIIVSLAIVKRYRAKGPDTSLRTVVVLKRILKEPSGLERFAIICSLPYMLLTWGLLAFLAAFSIIFYRGTGIQVRIPVTVAFFLVFLCVFFCLYTVRPTDREDQNPQKRPRKDSASTSMV